VQAQQSTEVNTMNDKPEETKSAQERGPAPVAGDDMLSRIIELQMKRINERPSVKKTSGKTMYLSMGQYFASKEDARNREPAIQSKDWGKYDRIQIFRTREYSR
jgi:hypothetical protein